MKTRTVILTMIASAAAGCHSDGRAPTNVTNATANTVPTPVPPVPAPPAAPTPATHGYFAGSIGIHDDWFYGEALITSDGLVRIYLNGNPYVPAAATTSRQFVGSIGFDAGKGEGSGVIYGQECVVVVNFGNLCDDAPAEITITTATRESLVGKITTTDGLESWSMELSWPTVTYLEPAVLELASGQYQEVLATFSPNDDAVLNIDDAGRLFFQDAESGCIGNGLLQAHGDGAFNVYDVTLLIEGCAPGYEASNGEFEGVATRTTDDGWGYWGDWLVAWLSTTDGAAAPESFAMWGSRF